MKNANEINEPAVQQPLFQEKKEISPVPEGEANNELPRDETIKEESAEVSLTDVQFLKERMQSLEQTVGDLAGEIKQLSQRVDLIPPQVRHLGTKVDDMTESISHPRIRDLLGMFLQLHDLVEQMGLAAPDTASAVNYQVLQDQILQTLELNGISRISDNKRFDPNIHKAVETVSCQDPDEDGEIVRIYRPGFRTNRAVFRYTEVVVKRASSPKSTP
ncbi:MAG: nucleotide exchange factor GrpE [Candidatus Aminicenantes bacterium]|jgi:molecular chaperone GrpE